jgi:DNA-binding NarL/FixJ family response regulator
MIKIAFIEDDARFARSLEESIRMQPDMHCLLTESSIESFLQKFPKRGKLDILFLDIDLPGKSGVDGLPILRKRLPETEIVMLTHNEDAETVFQALHKGAAGYLTKDFPGRQLPQFVQIVRKGGALMSPLIARKVIHHFNPGVQSAEVELSSKEIQILQLFSEGLSYADAGKSLGISVDGVRYHVRNIYRKLNVDNKVDALKAIKNS